MKVQLIDYPDNLTSFFVIGVFDPRLDESWPWHFHYEDGCYLSPKKRQCNMQRQAVFSSEAKALEFWRAYRNPKKLSFEILEFRTSRLPKQLVS